MNYPSTKSLLENCAKIHTPDQDEIGPHALTSDYDRHPKRRFQGYGYGSAIRNPRADSISLSLYGL